MVGSAPPRPAGGAPSALSAMIAPTAPASCAFFTLTVKPHVPRSTMTIFPAIADALVNGEQPSVVSGPAALAGSSPSTTCPMTPGDDSGGPNAAAPMAYTPAMVPGLVTRSNGVPTYSPVGTAASHRRPGDDDVARVLRGSDPLRIVIYSQAFPVDVVVHQMHVGIAVAVERYTGRQAHERLEAKAVGELVQETVTRSMLAPWFVSKPIPAGTGQAAGVAKVAVESRPDVRPSQYRSPASHQSRPVCRSTPSCTSYLPVLRLGSRERQQARPPIRELRSSPCRSAVRMWRGFDLSGAV